MIEKEKYRGDYFSYLDSNENHSRYYPAACQINRWSKNRKIEVIDLGCGNGSLAKFFGENILYTGVDHNRYAINYAKKKYKQYKNKTFSCLDNINIATDKTGHKYDVVILSGLLFHNINIKSLEKYNDCDFLYSCISNILKKEGFLIIIAPFAYGEWKEHDFWVQSRWKYNEVIKVINQLIKKVNIEIIFENLSKQIGIENIIRQQKNTPEWFVKNFREKPKNKYSGEKLATWTFILKSILIKYDS